MIKTTIERLKGVHPLLQKIFPPFLAECNHHIPGNDQGFLTLEVCLGWRAKEVQEGLWHEGRDADGNIIDMTKWRTNAHWDESFHSFLPEGLACAVDTGIYNSATKQWTWPEPRAREDASEEVKAKAKEADFMWATFAEIAPRFGLFPGYKWKRKNGAPLDAPHFQLNLGPWKAKPLKEHLGAALPGVCQGVIRTLWENQNPEALKNLAAILLQA